MKHFTTTLCTLMCILLATTTYAQFTLDGYLLTETGEPFVGAEIYSNPLTITDENGYFKIENLPQGDYILNSTSDRLDDVNGVTVCDLIAMANHIIGFQQFDSVFKIIAGDVNSSCSVTTLDMVMLGQLITGVVDEFTLVPSWLFVDPETSNQCVNLSSGIIGTIDSDKTINLVAIKLGDVNNSSTVDYPVPFIYDPSILPFEKSQNTVQPQNGFLVEFKATNFTEMLGFQFTLNYDPTKMEFVEMHSDELQILQYHKNEEGFVSVLWANKLFQGATYPNDEVVFTATFDILEETNLSESLEFTSDYAPIESINANGCNTELVDLGGPFTLDGYLLTETGEPFVGAEILSDPLTVTDETGYFKIENVPAGNYTLNSASDRLDYENGVTICDVIAMREHIVHIQPFNSIFKIIAGDVNDSASGGATFDGITGFDMIRISQLIIGMIDEFNNVPSWIFMDPDTYDSGVNPYDGIPGILTSDKTINLVAVKLGDVNNSSTVDYPVPLISDPSLLPFEKNENLVQPQDGFDVEFKAVSFTEMLGFQFTLNYDSTKMEFLEINSDQLQDVNYHKNEEGIVSVMWANSQFEGESLSNGEVVFTATFNILEETDLGESLEFTSDYATIESINANGCNAALVDLGGPYILDGYLLTETGEPFVGSEIYSDPLTLTDETGYFRIEDVPQGNYTLNSASDRTDDLNGVTICDAVAIRQHILGNQFLDSNFKKIAADINNSSGPNIDGITTFDVVLIDQLIVGAIDEFSAVPSWIFMDPETYIAGGEPDDGIPGQIDADKTINLVAVKKGDVNNTSTVEYPVTFVSDPSLLPFEKNTSTIQPQDEFVADFTALSFTEMYGFQFTLSYDPTKMEFIEISTDQFNFISNHTIADGIVTVTWFSNDIGTLTIPDGETVFSATFNILEETDLSESMEFTSDFAPIESVNINGCNSDLIEQEPNSTEITTSNISKLSIFPNPVSDMLNILFEVEHSTEVKLSIVNLLGQSLWNKNIQSSFINEQISTKDLVNGIYLLEIEVKGQKSTRKFIKVEN